ncbi:MAG: nucleoside-diphosphate kinase [Planctomycetota bacterium]|nr:MAG: nucleoside-diphosphate kinase [Planctomycetota bacterium]
MERTLIILKPDAVQRRLMGRIITRFEEKGFKIIAAKFVHIDRAMAQKHYAVHKNETFYESLLEFITRGPVLAFVLEAENAIEVSRKMMGSTFGHEAEPGTIRGDFGISRQYNLIHGSDAPETALKEIKLWFKPEELVDYEMPDRSWLEMGK